MPTMLDACPKCGYSLTGLPVEHNCPECGLHYDAQSAVYRHPNPKAVFVGLCGGLGWVGMFVQFPTMYRSVPPWGRALIILASIGFVVATMWMVRQLYRIYRSGPLIAVLPGGLFERSHKVAEKTVEWSDISRASVNPDRRTALLFIRSSKTVVSTGRFFRSPTEVERFVAQVNARIAAAQGDAAKKNAPT